MNVDLHSTAQFVENYWNKKSGLAAALVFVSLVLGGILASTSLPLLVTGGLLAASWIGVCGAWSLSHRVPKTKKNHVGFVISLQCEDDEESRQIREDFIVPLRQLLRSSNRGEIFHFIEFPQYLAKQIIDYTDAEKIRAKTRAHFMLYGRVRQRILGGKEHHIIELDGIVWHNPISKTAQQAFASEFTELLPRRIRISKENDLLSFQFTSEWASLVAQYIIATAAFISGDLDYAEELYKSALLRLGHQNRRVPEYEKLSERIPTRISDIYETRARRAVGNWRRTHEQVYIDELGNHLEHVVQKHKNELDVLNLRALHAFLKDRNTAQALRYLNKMKGAIKGLADPNIIGTWYYNVAFLRAYQGNLSSATYHYEKAAMRAVDTDIITQIEDFLCWVLDKEPDKYQLHYCLGYFNWKTKGDIAQAKSDFVQFLANRQEGEFEKEKEIVENWVVEMHSD